MNRVPSAAVISAELELQDYHVDKEDSKGQEVRGGSRKETATLASSFSTIWEIQVNKERSALGKRPLQI